MPLRYNFPVMNPRHVFVLSLSLLVLACSHEPTAPQTATAVVPTTLYEDNGRKPTVETWLERAKEAYRAGNFARATRFLETAFVYDIQGPDGAATDLLFYLYLSQGDYPRALKLARALVKKYPFRALSYYQAGLAELWSGDAQVASEHFRRALEFQEHPARTHFFLGLAYERTGNEAARAKEFQTAEKEYRQILKANPRDFTANFELAHLYLYWNVAWQKSEELIAAARKSLRNPDFENILNSYIYQDHHLKLLEGIYYTHKGEPQRAMAALWQTLSSAPDGAQADLAEIYYYLGMNYAALRADPQASNFLRKAAQTDPTGPYANRTEVALRRIASEKETRKTDKAPASAAPTAVAPRRSGAQVTRGANPP